MRKIFIILLFANQICYSQKIKLNEIDFDLNKLNFFNEFHNIKVDTVYSGPESGSLVGTEFSVYASQNCKYFLVVNYTSLIGKINEGWGNDLPGKTNCYLYQGYKLIWDESRENSISDCVFFENNGSVIIKWDHPFAENFQLFYDSNGGIIDTLPVNNNYGILDNNELLIKRWVADSLHLSIIDSSNELLWNRSISNQNLNVYTFESGNGRHILMTSKDTLYSYDNRFNLIWRKKFPRTNLNISYSGKHFLADIYEPIPNSKYLKHLYYEVYDNKTGLLLNRIKTFKLNENLISPKFGNYMSNSDLLYFYDCDESSKKTFFIISDIKGQMINSKIYNEYYDDISVCMKNNTLKIYNNGDIIDELVINYAP